MLCCSKIWHHRSLFTTHPLHLRPLLPRQLHHHLRHQAQVHHSPRSPFTETDHPKYPIWHMHHFSVCQIRLWSQLCPTNPKNFTFPLVAASFPFFSFSSKSFFSFRSYGKTQKHIDLKSDSHHKTQTIHLYHEDLGAGIIHCNYARFRLNLWRW